MIPFAHCQHLLDVLLPHLFQGQGPPIIPAAGPSPAMLQLFRESAMSMKSPIAVMHALEIGLLGPVQFGLLDEEIFVVIPTGDFNRVGSLWPGDFYIHIRSRRNQRVGGTPQKSFGKY